MLCASINITANSKLNLPTMLSGGNIEWIMNGKFPQNIIKPYCLSTFFPIAATVNGQFCYLTQFKYFVCTLHVCDMSQLSCRHKSIIFKYIKTTREGVREMDVDVWVALDGNNVRHN